MNELQTIVLSRMISPTRDKVSTLNCKIALLYARSQGFELACRAMILKARAEWLNYQTTTQRKWQRDTKNANKAKHHDSIAIREKYVRCQTGAN
jgi:hypothetical protein